MMSSIAAKLAEVDQRGKANSDILKQVQNILGFNDNNQSKHEIRQIDSLDADGGIIDNVKGILLQQHAKFKASEFKLNRVMDLVDRHERDLLQLRYYMNDVMDKDIDDFEDNGNLVNDERQHFVYNPMASEFTPRELNEPSKRMHHSTWPTIEDRTKDVAYSPRSESGSITHDQKLIEELDGKCEFGVGFLRFTDINEEVLFYKSRVIKLESELKKKDDLLNTLTSCAEGTQDRSYSQRQEWFEHKMRLLKQDKRRRGETIGKLLKCIDCMKDQGRIDESRVSEGKFVLQATLNTRGWPQEDRIQATVHALEAERVILKAHHDDEKEGSSAQEDVVTTEDLASSNTV